MKEILITSTVLIAVILLLRLILRKRVSKRLIYATWLLVALRLLIPVQFGQFQYSVTTAVERIEQQSPLLQQVQQDLQQPVIGPDHEERYDQLVQDYLSQTDNPVTVPPEVQTQLRQEAESETFTLAQLLVILWGSGAVLIAGWFVTTNLLFLRKAGKASFSFTDCSSPVPVRISPNVSTPCLAGLFRPKIYLTPESAAAPQSLNHVLTHELTHLKHLDHIWVWVRCLCLCLHWFNPLVWLAAMASKRDCELACDEAALKKLGEDQRIAYGRTLLATVTHTSVRIFHTTTAMSESGKQLKERVNFIVKKPKKLLIAAVCLVLTAALTTALVFTGCKAQDDSTPPSASQEQTKPTTEPTTNEPTTTPTVPMEPTTTQPQTEPVQIPTEPYDILLNTPSLQTDPTTNALQIAQDAINRYLWYGIEGICCDHTLVVADLSQYLTDAQQEEYYGQEYKITCCQSPEEVRAHIDRYLSKDLQRHGYPDDKLFKDGDGNLYITILPTGFNGYRHVTVISQTKNKIVARACIYDEDGCFTSRVFTLQATDLGYQITKVEEDEDYRCEPVIVDRGPNYEVLKYGDYYEYKIYDDQGYAKTDGSTGFRCPTVTRLSEDVWEVAVSYGTGVIERTYRNFKTARSQVYDYVIAVGYGKIAYLDGDLDNRVLVVCDIFDRTNAQTYEHLGFGPEPMPVSEAYFTADDDGYDLTFTYRIGNVTEATKSVYVPPWC